MSVAMVNDDAEDLSLESDEAPSEKPSAADLKLTAELCAHLEFNLGVDLKRIRLSVVHGQVHLQGSVASGDLKKEIEENLNSLPWVTELHSYLRVRED